MQPDTTGQTLMDGARAVELWSGSLLLPPETTPPPPPILWELLAHINSLIVRTHSRLNDSLFADEGIVD